MAKRLSPDVVTNEIFSVPISTVRSPKINGWRIPAFQTCKMISHSGDMPMYHVLSGPGLYSFKGYRRIVRANGLTIDVIIKRLAIS